MNDNDKPQIFKNRYEVIKNLGSGNSGVTYLVIDLEATNDRKVLKVIQLDEIDCEQVPESIRQAELLSNLNNDHIIKFYESFSENDCLYIVTEFCEGGNLDQHLKELAKQNHKLTEDQVIEWLTQILIGIKCLHRSGILHRNLKPKNIFLKSNQIKIRHFGINRTSVNEKPCFTSPEFLKDHRFESKSDIWSIGCLLYEMCTYQHAFNDTGLLNIVNKIVKEKPPHLPPLYSKELNDLLEKMFIKDPQNRPSANQLLDSFIIKHHQRNTSMPSRNVLSRELNLDWDIETSRSSSSNKDHETTIQHDNAIQEVNTHGQSLSEAMKIGQNQRNKLENPMTITASGKRLHPINNRSRKANQSAYNGTDVARKISMNKSSPDTNKSHRIRPLPGINRQIDDTLDSPRRSIANNMNRAIGDDTDRLNVDRGFNPIARGKRIDALRKKAIQLAGEDIYGKVYDYLMRQRTAQKRDPTIDEEKIQQGLTAFPGKPSDYFLIDQLVFLDMVSI